MTDFDSGTEGGVCAQCGEHLLPAPLTPAHRVLSAHDRHSLLLLFQALDAAGKDGASEHVMSGVNPQGCQVFSFTHPSAEELDHDFLWRTGWADLNWS